MVNIVCQRHGELSGRLRDALGCYRHQVFIERLGWDVSSTSLLPEREFDQFDHDGTLHIIALDQQAQVRGCARLLPTREPYLLGEVFGYLCRESPPVDATVWEISRFAAGDEYNPGLAMRVFWHSLHSAWLMGAKSVVAVTSLSLERYFLRNGVLLSRLGEPRRIKGEQLIALSFAAFQPAGVPSSAPSAALRTRALCVAPTKNYADNAAIATSG
jgi:acyl homoserine lactone synthase